MRPLKWEFFFHFLPFLLTCFSISPSPVIASVLLLSRSPSPPSSPSLLNHLSTTSFFSSPSHHLTIIIFSLLQITVPGCSHFFDRHPSAAASLSFFFSIEPTSAISSIDVLAVPTVSVSPSRHFRDCCRYYPPSRPISIVNIIITLTSVQPHHHHRRCCGSNRCPCCCPVLAISAALSPVAASSSATQSLLR